MKLKSFLLIVDEARIQIDTFVTFLSGIDQVGFYRSCKLLFQKLFLLIKFIL